MPLFDIAGPAAHLPDWAIILISLSIAFSAICGGAAKKNLIKKRLQTLVKRCNQIEESYANNDDNDSKNEVELRHVEHKVEQQL